MKKNKKNKSLCKENIVFLKYLHKLPLKRRNKFIRNICNKKEIETIAELVLNFLQNNIKCTNKIIKSLKKYSKIFSSIIKKSVTSTKKKKLLTSKVGGFILSTLLNIGLPILSKLFLK